MSARNAAEAYSYGGRPAPRPTMRLLDFTPIGRGSLIGLARIRLPIGLTIHGVLVLRGRNGPWAALPSRPQIKRDGTVKKIGDKTLYDKVVEWHTRGLADRFSARVIELVRAAGYADQLDGTLDDGGDA